MMTHGLEWEPASKKRQGTKSRLVVQRRCGVRYGDFAAGLGFRGWTAAAAAVGLVCRKAMTSASG